MFNDELTLAHQTNKLWKQRPPTNDLFVIVFILCERNSTTCELYDVEIHAYTVLAKHCLYVFVLFLISLCLSFQCKQTDVSSHKRSVSYNSLSNEFTILVYKSVTMLVYNRWSLLSQFEWFDVPEFIIIGESPTTRAIERLRDWASKIFHWWKQI